MKKRLLIAFLVTLLLTGCKKEQQEDEIKKQIEVNFGSESYYINQKIDQNDNNYLNKVIEKDETIYTYDDYIISTKDNKITEINLLNGDVSDYFGMRFNRYC